MSFDAALDAPPVLVVAPNPVHRLVLKAAMESAGYRADTAGDGDRAVERVQRAIDDNGLYTLVLMDTELPIGERLALSGRIRELGVADGSLPLVALTGDSDDSGQARALTTADLKTLAERLARLTPRAATPREAPLDQRLALLQRKVERLADETPGGIDAVVTAEYLADDMRGLVRDATQDGHDELASAAARFDRDFRTVRDRRRLAVLARAARALIERFRQRGGKTWPESSSPTTIPYAANSLPV